MRFCLFLFYYFAHSLTFKFPTVDYLIIHSAVTQFFIKAYGTDTAVDKDFRITDFLYPLLCFLDNLAAKVFLAIFGQNNNTSEQNTSLVKFIETTGSYRVCIIQKHYVFAFIPIVFIKFLTQ